MKTAAAIMLLILISNQFLFAVCGGKDNFVIFENLFEVSAESAIEELRKKKIEKCSLKISDHSASWLLKSKLLDISSENEILLTDEIMKNPKIEANIFDTDINYKKYDGNRLIREILIKIEFLLEDKQGNITKLKSESHSFKDTLTYDCAEELNQSTYGFATGRIPEKPTSFFDTILQPVIVIGSAAAVVAILFTVRSE